MTAVKKAKLFFNFSDLSKRKSFADMQFAEVSSGGTPLHFDMSMDTLAEDADEGGAAAGEQERGEAAAGSAEKKNGGGGGPTCNGTSDGADNEIAALSHAENAGTKILSQIQTGITTNSGQTWSDS